MKQRKAQAPRATAWLSCDLATFVQHQGPSAKRPKQPQDFDFDVLIVGSGYGGSVALAELAGYGLDARTPLRIGLLERGKEYLPGAFPASMAEMGGHMRWTASDATSPSGRADSLFDIRLGADLNVLLANGLGGGSLINAGVMAWPHQRVFQNRRWPQAIQADADRLEQHAEALKASLGAQAVQPSSPRSSAMHHLAGATPCQAVQATLAQAADTQLGTSACIGCGDCATGCNHGAKRSLDTTLLAQARAQHPPEHLWLITGATVMSCTPKGASKPQSWTVSVVHTDMGIRRKQPEPYELRTRHLILAAGALGSSEILLRSQLSGLSVATPRLGKNFSANGDNIAIVYGKGRPLHGVADAQQAPASRGIGPTITSIIDLRTGSRDDLVIQDLAVPAALRKVFEEVATTSQLAQSMDRSDKRVYTARNQHTDLAAVDPQSIDNSLLVALIGHDDANGQLQLCGDGAPGDGAIRIVWPKLRRDPRFEAHQATLAKLVRKRMPGYHTLPNPIWRPMPSGLESIFGRVRGPLFTVHPLGGCAMGESSHNGVVNHLGQVFTGQGSEVYPNLVVLDGSIIPSSLGINPALTIAALAQRAIRQLRTAWGYTVADAAAPTGDAAAAIPRPRFRILPIHGRPSDPTPTPTEIEVTEKLRSTLTLNTADGPRTYTADLELWFQPVQVTRLITSRSDKRLNLDASRSRLRLWPLEAMGCGAPVLEAPLHGAMILLRHLPSDALTRQWRGLAAWWLNRGLRDLVQRLRKERRAQGPRLHWTLRLQRWARSGRRQVQIFRSAWRLASRAGDGRLIEYELQLGRPVVDRLGCCAELGTLSRWEGAPIRAHKQLVYERAANLFNQLTRARLTAFPNWQRDAEPTQLHVDLAHFGSIGVPLARVVKQNNQVDALADMSALLLYLARALLPVHLWSMRLPDPPRLQPAQRLPGKLPGAGEPQVFELQVDLLADGRPVCIRLTRYPSAQPSSAVPVLLLHGYSASGTTFAHPSLAQGGLAGSLCSRGRDVWVLDLRSSAGMPLAQEPWTFEQMGYQDIPVAVDHILMQTGAQQLDIVAHCMGAAMLSLGLFGHDDADPGLDLYPALRRALPQRIRRLVFSQLGPAMVSSPANIARAYLLLWAQHFIAFGVYNFSLRGQRSLSNHLIDRLLATLPYPREEFERENPIWPLGQELPWVGTRHRMDALYGMTFKLSSMSDQVLNHIDDFFGPINLQTITQVIHFARSRVVTDSQGDGSCMVPERIGQQLAHCERILSLHSEDNGLVDIKTRQCMDDLMRAAGLAHRYQSLSLADTGHQDSLIGTRSWQVYAQIADFLA